MLQCPSLGDMAFGDYLALVVHIGRSNERIYIAKVLRA